MYLDDNARNQRPRSSIVDTIIQRLQDDLARVEFNYRDLKEALAGENIVIDVKRKSLLQGRELLA